MHPQYLNSQKWKGSSTINSWGSGASTCYETRITGLPQVRSFTFWLRIDGAYAGKPTLAIGAVYAGANGTVASVDIPQPKPNQATSCP
jgi:hypothetical protein